MAVPVLSSAPAAPWVYAGLASSFPNIDPPTGTTPTRIANPPRDAWDDAPAADEPPPRCRIFEHDAARLTELGADAAPLSRGATAQMMIFRYRGQMHAVDHVCPHRAYPLSRGTLHDIEDFGVVLSAGIACPKHGWAFDLTTGQSDRGAHRLGIWEVELRAADAGDEQVWVRRKAGPSR